MANITGIMSHESIGVLNYQVGQHYEAHTDYFDPAMYGVEQSTQRFATFFLFFNNVKKGGFTTVPRAGGGQYPKEFKYAACHQGIQVQPKKGSALIFWGMRKDRSLDPFSLHGGCDVEEGEKWAGPVWYRAPTPPGTGHSHE